VTQAASMSGLLALIERATPEGGEWCEVGKATQLAALVLALRPRTIVEIGVFLGGSLIPMALAQAHYAFPAREVCWAVDPWQASASAEGQEGDNATWWGKLDHEHIYERFLGRIARYSLGSIVQVARVPSDDFRAPDVIDLCHIDGNHGPQVARDVAKLAPRIPVGGILLMDDCGWHGGHVSRARDAALEMGFVELYPLGTGVVLQRKSAPASPAQMQGLH